MVVTLSTCGGGRAGAADRNCAEQSGAQACIVHHASGDELIVTGLEPGSPGTLLELPEQVLARMVARSDGTISMLPLAAPAPLASVHFEGLDRADHQIEVDLHWPR
jgi:hypothetical protein